MGVTRKPWASIELLPLQQDEWTFKETQTELYQVLTKKKKKSARPTLQYVMQRVSFGFALDSICLKPCVSMTKQVVGILKHVLECFSRM